MIALQAPSRLNSPLRPAPSPSDTTSAHVENPLGQPVQLMPPDPAVDVKVGYRNFLPCKEGVVGQAALQLEPKLLVTSRVRQR